MPSASCQAVEAMVSRAPACSGLWFGGMLFSAPLAARPKTWQDAAGTCRF